MKNTNRTICAICGHSVKQGSGFFINRVPILTEYEERKEIYKFPEGEWICRECDFELYDTEDSKKPNSKLKLISTEEEAIDFAESFSDQIAGYAQYKGCQCRNDRIDAVQEIMKENNFEFDEDDIEITDSCDLLDIILRHYR